MDELPTITVQQLNEVLAAESPITLLDVREIGEVAQSSLQNIHHIPLGELAQRLTELNPAEPIAVICKSGGRSARATALLVANGFIASNVQGGMLAYVAEVDPTLPPVL